MSLPQSVMYPDGTFGPKPHDGKSYFVGDKHYIWDDAIEKWVDSKGECWSHSSNGSTMPYEVKKSQSNGCECGAWVGGKYVRHSSWCPKHTNPDYISDVPFDEWKKNK